MFEHITLDMVLEGLGTVFGVGLVWSLFLNGGINKLLEILIIAIG